MLNKKILISSAVRTALNESLFDDGGDFDLDDTFVISAEVKPQTNILRHAMFEDRLKEIFDRYE